MKTSVTITLGGCPASDDARAFAARAAAKGLLPCVPDAIDHDAPLVRCHFDAIDFEAFARDVMDATGVKY